MKALRGAFWGTLATAVGAAFLHVPSAGAAPATVSVSCPVSVLLNSTYTAEVKVDVGSGAPCQPPGQSATMCGLGAYNLTLTYNPTLVTLVPASAGFPIDGGTSTGFTSQPPPPTPTPPAPAPDCSLGCQLPSTDPTTFSSGSTSVSSFNSATDFSAPLGLVSILRAKVQGISLGYSDVGVSSTNLQVFDTVGAPFAVTIPVPKCQTAVSQYQCLGDKNANGCVVGLEILDCRRSLGACESDGPSLYLNPQCDGNGDKCITGDEVLRTRKNLDACAADGTCFP